MKKDSHGGNIYKKAKILGIRQEDILDFSANISPLGLPAHIRQAMVDSIEGTINYPDPECVELKERIAEQDGVESEWITCGNGGADLLYRLAFGLQPKKALLAVPAFVEYEEALEAAGTEVTYYKMEHDFTVKEDFLERITPEIDLIVLCNPNNPTGILTPRVLIQKILQKACEVNAVLLLDECFLEICEQENDYTLKPFLGEYPNLVILKSFTKLYAIPGVRLGYVLSSNLGIIEKINRAGQAWSVSHIAQCAGIAALSQVDYKKAVIASVREELHFMKESLRELPLKLYDGMANYLFFQTPGITGLDKQLEKRGILIRNCSNYVNLGEDYWRVAVKTREENIQLLDALREILGR